jgi:spermidine synthase
VPDSDHRFGKLIHSEEDDLGEIHVYERDGMRILTFGNPVEQSCMHLASPWQLEHEYTRGMMLGLLLNADSRSALVLGLGGGSLVRALRHARPGLRIDAVDYRMAVIRIAQEYFELRTDKGMHLHCDEAQRFIAAHEGEQALIFTDLYVALGAHEAQHSGDFLLRCRERLSANGLLLVNQWCASQQEMTLARQAIRDAFAEQVLHLHVNSGNQIAFCFNGKLPALNRKRFFEEAQALGMKLGIPLQRLARSFWQQNAMALQLRRFPGQH